MPDPFIRGNGLARGFSRGSRPAGTPRVPAPVEITTSITVQPTDSGKVFECDMPLSGILTLPNRPPSVPWWIVVININPVEMVVASNLLLNGSNADLVLQAGQGVTIWSDGQSGYAYNGGNGITGLTSFDGSVIITNPNGPIPNLSASVGAGGTNLGLFNVKSYGAIGDGVHDDSTAVRAAIAAAQARNLGLTGTQTFNPRLGQSVGGIVFFPPGLYLMGSSASVSVSGITLQGSGPLSSILLVPHGATYSPIIVSGAGSLGNWAQYSTYCEYITIKELSVWQNFGTVKLAASYAPGTHVTSLAVASVSTSLPIGTVIHIPNGTTNPVYNELTDTFTLTSAASVGATVLTGSGTALASSLGSTPTGWANNSLGVMGPSNNTPGIVLNNVISPTISDVGIFHFGTGLQCLHGVVDFFCEKTRVTTFYASASVVYGVQLVSNVYSTYFDHCLVFLDNGSFSPGVTSYAWYGDGDWLSDIGWDTCEADNATYGFYLRTTGGYHGDIRMRSIIADNVQFGIWVQDFSAFASGAIDIDSCWCAVTKADGTQPAGLQGQGITVINCNGLTIRGSQVIGETTALNFWGIYLNNTLWTTIADSLIKGSFTQHIIADGGSSVVMITGNVIEHVGGTGLLGGHQAGPNGIYIQDSSYITATSNAIASDTLVSSPQNPATAVSFAVGILADATSSKLTLTGNMIDPLTVVELIDWAYGASNISTLGNVNFDTGGFMDPLALLRTFR